MFARKKHRGSHRHFVLCFFLAISSLSSPSDADESTDLADSQKTGTETTADEDSLGKALDRYCVRCHGGEKTKGKVDLKKLRSKASLSDNIELVRKVVEALEAKDMPPEDEEQPTVATRTSLTEYFQAIVDDYLEREKPLHAITMRRLNRYEYNNSIRDLFRLRGDIYPLPEKVLRSDRPYYDPASGRFPEKIQVGNRTLGKFQVERPILTGVVPFALDLQSEHGFNNRGDEMSLSPILLESLLKLSRSILASPQFDEYCEDYDKIFKQPDGDAKQVIRIAQDRLRAFMTRAFRRPVDDETFARYSNALESSLKKGMNFPAAMKRILAAVLVSPHFVYIAEQKQGDVAVSPLDDFELATRLSYFLWSSVPDQALLARARAGELRQSDTLEKEVRRMLGDRRSKALAENFARQWLRLDQLITAVPDDNRFPIYYSRIGCEYWKFGLQTMVEPLLLFESVLVEDRSIMKLIDSDYSYRSNELHAWYRKAKPFGGRGEGNRFNTFRQTYERRELQSRREGGVLTCAAVLTMTSSPLRTSPITRGAWVATVILNRPPAPPPDDIPEIEADDDAIEATGLTLRQRLSEHTKNQSCATCHSKIDPLGFVLENYDAVGRWRDTYRSGLPIDASGKLGEEPFRDIEEFKDILVRRPEIFMRAFAEHLLSYALGRGLDIGDVPAVDKIVEHVKADGGRMSTLIVEIVKSRPFLSKTNQARETEQP